MNRKIKFRAWDKKEKYIADVYEIDFIYENVILLDYGAIDEFETHSRNFDEIELLQYIGLKDKNGKEIYEGDIVRVYIPYYNENNKVKLEYKVFYFEEGAFFQLENIKDKNDLDTFCSYSNKKLEVVGNIYENPELLEVNKNE